MAGGSSSAAGSRRTGFGKVALIGTGLVVVAAAFLFPQGARPAVKPKGKPVVVMTQAPLTSQVQNWPSIKESAQVMVKAINANGGVGKNHRPLKLMFCDDKFQPQPAVACTQSAIKNKAVAMIAGYNAFGDITNPLLQRAGIPVFEPYGLAASDFSNPNVYPSPNSVFGVAVGAGSYAVRANCKKVNLFAFQAYAAFFIPLVRAGLNNAAKRQGKKVKISQTIIPVTASDYAPYLASALAGKPDCIGLIMDPAQTILTMRAYLQQKYRVKHIVTCNGCIDERTIAASGGRKTVLNSAIIVSGPPVWSNRALSKFKGYLKRFHANNSVIAKSHVGSIYTYQAFQTFAQIANGLNDVTAASFKKRLNSLKQIPNVYPGLPTYKGASWRKRFPVKGFNRIPNGSWTMTNTTVTKGKIVNPNNRVTDPGSLLVVR